VSPQERRVSYARTRWVATGGLDDAAAVLGDFRIEELAAERLEAFERLPRPPS
jgi:hypothetical protein